MFRWFLALFLVTSIVFGGISFSLWQKASTPKTGVITPTPTIDPFPTDIPLVTPTESIQPTVTFTPVDPVTRLNRTTLSVAIQNGSGVFGAGTKMATLLRDFGYHVVSIESAKRYDVEKTSIFIKPEKKQFLPLLQKDVASLYPVASASATLSPSAFADALIIVGEEK